MQIGEYKKLIDISGETKTYYKRKYEWPNELAQQYFTKQCSQLWESKIRKEGILNSDRWIKIFNTIDINFNGQIPVSQWVILCDHLKLYILNSSGDLSYHFKFLDVMNQNYKLISADGKYIDKNKYNILYNDEQVL